MTSDRFAPGVAREALIEAASTADVVTLAIAGFAVIVSIVGTVLSNQRAMSSDRIARGAVAVSRDALSVSREALDDAREAKVQALWSDAIEAVHRVIIDPTMEPVQDRLTNLRVRVIALVMVFRAGRDSIGGLRSSTRSALRLAARSWNAPVPTSAWTTASTG